MQFQRARDANRARRWFWYVAMAVPAWVMLLIAVAGAFDEEFAGKFESQLVPDDEDNEQVVFKPFRELARLKIAKAPASDATVTAGRLYHAASDESAILTLLVEPQGEAPYLLADVNLDNVLEDGERFELKRSEADDPQLLEATVNQPLKEGPFQSFPATIRYFRQVRRGDMNEGDRLILESRGAFARGFVEIQGKKTLVEYQYNARTRKMNPKIGKLGVDSNGDGEIDRDRFSPEFAEARDEAIVFRVGTTYVSTKKADIEKNVIVLKGHSAADYRRVELPVGAEMPDFEFADFNGKKRKLSEFRGKYLLIDFWGMWCPPCREELPYLKTARSRFQARGFEILGMNTDQPEIVPQVKAALEKNGMNWPQAKPESIYAILRSLRVQSFPTTVLLGPDGKVISRNNTRKGEPDLRGQDLIESLDKLLPK